MSKHFLKGISLIIAGAITFFSSCDDEPLNVGLQILPEVDILEASVDTQSIKCLTVSEAFPQELFSIVGSNGQLINTNCPIGHIKDPLMGQMWAQTLIQLSRGDDYYKADTTDVIESCFLYLNINSSEIFGSKNDVFDIYVYSLVNQPPLNLYTNYKVKTSEYNHSPESESTAFEVINIEEMPIDSGDYIAIKLNNSFIERITDSNLTTSSAFYENFPGFYLTASAKGDTGAIANFSYDKSRLVLKYKREKSTGGDTTIYSYHPINNFKSFFRHDFVEMFMPERITDSTERDNYYVQSLDGLKGYIEFSELDSFKANYGDKAGINLAELVLPLDPDFNTKNDSTKFFLPRRITARTKEKLMLPFESALGSSYRGGYLDLDNLEYRINVSEFVHQYLQNGNYGNGLYILASEPTFNNYGLSEIENKNPRRVVLNSGSNNGNRPYLRLIYTLTEQ